MANKDNSEAAKKIASAEKEKKTAKPKNKKANIFVRMGKAIARFCKDCKAEIKKITWPDAKTVLKGTAVTMVCIAIIGVVIFFIDLGLTNGIKGLRSVAENRTTTTTTVAETTEASASTDESAALTVTTAVTTAQ
jgi:preprotein translocase SecE subunit